MSRALHGPEWEMMFLQEHQSGMLGISDSTML